MFFLRKTINCGILKKEVLQDERLKTMENERKLMQFHFITNGEISTHYHQNPELFYVLKGTLEVQIDDASFVLKHGDMIVINANKRHKMIGSKELLGARFEIDFHLLAEELGTLQ